MEASDKRGYYDLGQITETFETQGEEPLHLLYSMRGFLENCGTFLSMPELPHSVKMTSAHTHTQTNFLNLNWDVTFC